MEIIYTLEVAGHFKFPTTDPSLIYAELDDYNDMYFIVKVWQGKEVIRVFSDGFEFLDAYRSGKLV